MEVAEGNEDYGSGECFFFFIVRFNTQRKLQQSAFRWTIDDYGPLPARPTMVIAIKPLRVESLGGGGVDLIPWPLFQMLSQECIEGVG
ncbi:hypothetical protein Syun_006268 [Stephania yunnanensis]|uniref:Uncharacterized protein n=1 Tax=Stephania yunnanensis TaxID=152371 RepID=A0AAP0KW93_9MAGN